MLFFMDSKVFEEEFLVNEKDKDILNAQYVIISTRIRKTSSGKNIICANNELYPCFEARVLNEYDDWETDYLKHLESNAAFIAVLIMGIINEKYNVFFICTKNENKIGYLNILSNFIEKKFKFPCYDYEKYIYGNCEIKEYDKDKILKKCKKVIKKQKERQYNENLSSSQGRESIKKSFQNMSKKELIKELKKQDLYQENMDKEEMIEILETFI